MAGPSRRSLDSPPHFDLQSFEEVRVFRQQEDGPNFPSVMGFMHKDLAPILANDTRSTSLFNPPPPANAQADIRAAKLANGPLPNLSQVQHSIALSEAQLTEVENYPTDIWVEIPRTPPTGADRLRSMHLGTILPKLESLLAQSEQCFCLSLSGPFLDGNEYTQAYDKLVIAALTNNLADLDHFPAISIFEHIRSRFTTEEIAAYLTSLPRLVNIAFCEGLLKCAVSAADTSIIEFALSQKDFGLDVNKITGLSRGERRTLLEQSAYHKDTSVARILLERGAEVNKTHNELNGGPLYLALYKDPGRRDYFNLLLKAGAEVTSRVFHRALLMPDVEQHSALVEELLEHANTRSWSIEEKAKIFLISIMILPDHLYRLLAVVLLQIGADPNLDVPASVLSELHKAPKEPLPTRVIDAVAKRGDMDLFGWLISEGAVLTGDTLPFAIMSANYDLIALILQAHRPAGGFLVNEMTFDAIQCTSLDVIELLEQESEFSQPCLDRNLLAMIDNASEAGDTDTLSDLLDTLAIGQQPTESRAMTRSSKLSGLLRRHLIKAISAGRHDVAGVLINGGANVECCRCGDPLAKDSVSHSPLLAALQAENPSLVSALLNAGADPRDWCAFDATHDKFVKGRQLSPLQLAMEWGAQSIVTDLLYAGADVNECFNVEYVRECPRARRAVTIAVENRDFAMVRTLIKHGADLDVSMNAEKEVTALQAAVRNQDYEMIDFLLEFGADPADSAALMEAVTTAPEIVHILLQRTHERYPKGRCRYGTHAIQHAIREGSIELISTLIKAGVDIGHMPTDGSGDYGESPMATAIKAHGVTSWDIISLLIDNGVDPNDVVACPKSWQVNELSATNNIPRHTALLEAIRVNKLDSVKTLINKGADVNWPTGRGVERTPLQYACELGNLDIVRVLLENNANVNAPPAKTRGGTALQLAAIGGFAGIAELLLTNGADINGPIAEIHGRSAINGAAEHGRFHMVSFLIHYGRNLGINSLRMDTEAVRLAQANGHGAIVELLESHLDEDQASEPPEPAIRTAAGENVTDKPLCERCFKTFANLSSLSRHMRTNHPSPYEQTQWHQCCLCPRGFKRKDTFQRHLSSLHTKEKHVLCQECGQGFRGDYFRLHHLDDEGRCKRR